jgi:hypothetical protein
LRGEFGYVDGAQDGGAADTKAARESKASSGANSAKAQPSGDGAENGHDAEGATAKALTEDACAHSAYYGSDEADEDGDAEVNAEVVDLGELLRSAGDNGGVKTEEQSAEGPHKGAAKHVTGHLHRGQFSPNMMRFCMRYEEYRMERARWRFFGRKQRLAFFLAVDLGGTKTEYVLADETRELARVKGGTIKRMRTDEATADDSFTGLCGNWRLRRRLNARCDAKAWGSSITVKKLVADWIRRSLPSSGRSSDPGGRCGIALMLRSLEAGRTHGGDRIERCDIGRQQADSWRLGPALSDQARRKDRARRCAMWF